MRIIVERAGPRLPWTARQQAQAQALRSYRRRQNRLYLFTRWAEPTGELPSHGLKEIVMRRWLPCLAFAFIWAAPAAAADLPARKPGLWELKMAFEGGNLPAQTAEHCIDAETDKLMSATGGSVVQEMCSKPEIQKTGDTIIVDSTCKIGPFSTSSHAVITGDFDSAYTVKVVSKQEGPALPGMPTERTMTIDAKWAGPARPTRSPAT